MIQDLQFNCWECGYPIKVQFEVDSQYEGICYCDHCSVWRPFSWKVEGESFKFTFYKRTAVFASNETNRLWMYQPGVSYEGL